MGRTLATATQLIRDEEQAFRDFRRALRRADQQALDDLFVHARKHVAAVAMAAHALPLETILLAMLVEEHNEVLRLRQAVVELARRLESLDGQEH